ncbi:hypothetical protein [Phytoactinopolyspora mesophila]|uniref:Copper resistance protein D domain-containing protein n=1 Tax=Phytoactinopolyspora mesophila TaxID=2650750 RepID=A0A7K3M2M4_9ACTN|nr:hypothetical protein [Phytoactinopolyspora mesophila]NDL57536.1 hypothetical protein [Phytoactinopolyspora mesophila]
MVTSALAVAHIGLLAVWLGSMLYSLLIVQPRAARFFAADDDTLEEFLTVLGSGNRRPVVGIVVALFATGGALAAVETNTASEVLFAVEGMLLAVAAFVFARVSWRLWPRRVFALPEERGGHRAALHRHALLMVGLVGAAFVVAVVAVTLPG